MPHTSLPEMTRPTGTFRSRTLRHHDGSRRVVHWTEHEIPYPDGRLIVSRTDLAGTITHANDAFVELSGYSHDELMGAPHCLLRHPDMPRLAFKRLWEAALAGKQWHGYLKNLRKDGACYWVYATTLPNIRRGRLAGFTSVQRMPSRERVEEIIPVYRQWLLAEDDGNRDQDRKIGGRPESP